MRVGSASTFPLFPVRPDREAGYPKEPGQAVFGKPYLDLSNANSEAGGIAPLKTKPDGREDLFEEHLKALAASRDEKDRSLNPTREPPLPGKSRVGLGEFLDLKV